VLDRDAWHLVETPHASERSLCEPPTIDVLQADVSNLLREKWDWALPEALPRISYTILNLDLDAAMHWARSVN